MCGKIDRCCILGIRRGCDTDVIEVSNKFAPLLYHYQLSASVVSLAAWQFHGWQLMGGILALKDYWDQLGVSVGGLPML